MYIGISLENTTGNEFRFGLSGRYLAFDLLGSGSETRIDASIGSDPSVGATWYRPLGSSRMFIEPGAGVASQSLSAIQDGHTYAQYTRTRAGLALDGGVNAGRLDEVRGGLRYGWSQANISIGDPGLPELNGEDSLVLLQWTHDGQDDAIVPTRGLHSVAWLHHYFSAPVPSEAVVEDRTSEDVTQFQAAGSWLKSLDRAAKRRMFLSGGIGTSFDGEPFPTEQFALGGPLRMSAFNVGEQRGDHFAQGAFGYLHQLMRLPDFLGGPVFAGGSTAWSISSTGSRPRPAMDGKAGSPTTSRGWTSLSSMSWATCPSPNPADSSCSTSSAGSTSGPRSSSPRTSPSGSGRVSSAIPR